MNAKLVIRRKRQLPEINAAALLAPFTITLVVFVSALLARQNAGIEISVLTEDAGLINNPAWFTGIISTLGICLLAAATGIGYFAGNFRKTVASGPRSTSALYWLSICSLMLLLDDAFQFDETLSAEIPLLPEAVTQGAIGLLIILTLVLFRSAIASSFIYAIPAVLCWTVSVSVDMLPHDNASTFLLAEDGSKLLGIMLWYRFISDLATRYFVAMRVPPVASSIGGVH